MTRARYSERDTRVGHDAEDRLLVELPLVLVRHLVYQSHIAVTWRRQNYEQLRALLLDQPF